VFRPSQLIGAHDLRLKTASQPGAPEWSKVNRIPDNLDERGECGAATRPEYSIFRPDSGRSSWRTRLREGPG
jgi:hypothetical protein